MLGKRTDAVELIAAGEAMRLGLGLYFVPLAFVANPGLINLENQPLIAFLAFGKVALGLWLLSKSMISGVSLSMRTVQFVVGVLTIFLFGVGAN